MRGVAIRLALGLGFLLACGLAGCVTPGPAAPSPKDPPNPFVDEICKQEVLVLKGSDGKDYKPDPPMVKPDVVLREVPLQTPLADARKIMERHGFSCQGGVQDNYQYCVWCTAYRRKSPQVADRVVVKLYYKDNKVVNIAVTVELGLKRGNTLFPEF